MITPYTTKRQRGFNKIDLLGVRFERLLVTSQHQADKNGNSKWLCVCDCGKERGVYGTHLRSGKTKSCGCLHKEIASTPGITSPTDGYTKMPEYKIWAGMIKRCSNKRCVSFKNYGGRGIAVSSEWMKAFSSFYSDMGPRPGAQFSIERIDNDGPYSANNCKWATKVEQSSNTRRSVYFQGRTLKQWSVELGIAYATVWERFHKYGTTIKGEINAHSI